MPKYQQRYTASIVQDLAEVRESARITQEQAAQYFGVKDRNTIAGWELGYNKPHDKHRSAFIGYLWYKLKLRRDSERFRQIWRDVMMDQWGWEKLKQEELPRGLHEENTARGKGLTMPPIAMNELLSIGGIDTYMIVLAWGVYGPKQIRCSYSDQAISLLPELQRLKDDLVNECKEKEARGDTPIPYNSLTYKLKAFDVGYRIITQEEEIPILDLAFGPTDYFTHCVTDLNVHNRIRDRYLRTAKDITTEPVPEFATTLGINLNLITSDGYLIVTERSQKTETEPGTLHTSVGEGLLRPADAGVDGAPDLFRCAIRGALEELGLLLKREAIEFNAFCVHVERGQYSLFGWSKVKETKADVERLRVLSVPKDKWENRSLQFVLYNLSSIVQLIRVNVHRWSATGLASLIFGLMHMGYTPNEIHEAFLRT